jgi:acyl-CoA synthetase (AMP-forming)/AMP-acid ligase II
MSTIRKLIDDRAGKYPEQIFLFAPEPGLTLSYSQLRKVSIALGKQLMRLGLRKGDKFSFMMGNGFQTTRIFLGGMYSGFTLAPLNLLAQPSQLEYVLDHSDTKLVFFTEEHKKKLEKSASKVHRHIKLVQIDNDVEAVFPAEKDSPDFKLPDVTEDDDALLLYTSGTTGKPKGVVLSHKNLIAGGRYTTMAHELGPEDRALCSLPVYHINGAVVTVITPLVSGGSVVVPHKFSVSNFWELLSEYRCTWFSVVPTILSYLLSSTNLKEKNLKLGHVRFGRSASSPLPPALHKAFEEKFGVPIIETMGLTETAAPVFSNPLDSSTRKYGSPGRPVGNEAKIVDKNGREVTCGNQGEIMVRGDNVMKGYYKVPDLTAKTLESDGWLHTGDVGYMDEDGFVFVTGRIKELIIKGGENIAPREIDEALYSHPAVMECAAVGIPDDHYGEEIMCCVVLKPGCQATEEELRHHCFELLGQFKTPKTIRFLEDLPKGPSGKIQRIKLRENVREFQEEV